MGNQSSKPGIEKSTCFNCDGAEVFHVNLCHNPSLCRTPTHPCYTCNSLEALETRVQDTLAKLKKLMAKHQEMKTRLNLSHSPIVDKMPVEIMSRIFQFCTQTSTLKAPDLRLQPWTKIFFPLRLGAVCRNWREIAWSTPRIWTYLSISLHRDSRPQYMCLIQEWIRRSKVLPLTLCLSQYGSVAVRVNGDVILSSYEPLFKELARSSSRWSSVHIDMPSTLIKNLVLYCRDASSIWDLSIISSTEVDDVDENDNVCPGWATPPEPESVSIYRFLPAQVNLKWNKVTSITASDWRTNECIGIIRNSPMLVDCSFLRTRPILPSSDIELGMPIVHDGLQELRFEGRMRRIDFFAAVAFPNLKSLKYKFYDDSGDYTFDEDDVTALQGFVARSGSQLKFLEIEYLTLAYDELRPLLEAVPLLRNLSLFPDLWGSDDDIFTAKPILKHLARTRMIAAVANGDTDSGSLHSAERFLPCLEVFSLYRMAKTDFPWKYVPRIFSPPSEFGNPQSRPLRTFELVYDCFDFVEFDAADVIPEDVLLPLIDLGDVGAQILCTDARYSHNLLDELMQEFHRSDSIDSEGSSSD